MSNMPDIYKRQVGIRVPLELDAMVLKEFSREADKTDSIAYIRALEEATRDIVLDDKDHKKIAEKIKRNKQKRKGVK